MAASQSSPALSFDHRCRGHVMLTPLSLSEFSNWSKDFIFVFPDGELEGTQAFISEYYGRAQSSKWLLRFAKPCRR